MSQTNDSKTASSHTSGMRRVLSGSLDDVDLFSIVQFLILQRKTGILTIANRDISATVWFENGQIINGRYPGAADGLEAIRRIFKETKGTFEFHPCPVQCPVLVTTDSQSLLMDLAIEADESSRIMPAIQVEPSIPPLADSAPPVHPVVARLVRPASDVLRQGDTPPAFSTPTQTPFIRHQFSQEEFVRRIEERREQEDSLLPSRRRDILRRPSPRARPARSLTAVVALVGIPVIIIVAGIIAWMTASTTTTKPVQAALPKPAPSVPKREYKFVTAPNSPARQVENAFTDLHLHCFIQSIEFDPKDVRQVNIVLLREAYWDKTELANAIALDSIALIQRIFDTQPHVEKVFLVAKSRLSREPGQETLDEAFTMTALRSTYLGLKPTYNLMSPLVIIDRFGGRFSPKLIQP